MDRTDTTAAEAPRRRGAGWPDAVQLEPAELAAAREVGSALAERFGVPAALPPWRDRMWDGSERSEAVLHIDDFSAIPFLVGVSGVEEYQHRARTRARDGELYAAVTPPTPGYESYCRDLLGLGSAELLGPTPVSGPLFVADACAAGSTRERLIEKTRELGGLLVHPFLGAEVIWRLARRIAEAAGCPARVLAPPPPVTWVANDKARFTELIVAVLGAEWIVESQAAADPERLAALLTDMAGRHAQVGMKRLRCASGMGNWLRDSSAVLERGEEWTVDQVRAFLTTTEWDGEEEVLAVAWEQATASPSAQLWIPPTHLGPPRLDGIYEQLLEGEARVFAGSRPTTLPAAVNAAIGKAALKASAALQQLGYVGRCSYDLLLLGDPAGDFSLRFVECNGRWGGTSTPMNLLDRLVSGPRPPYRAQDVVHPDLVGVAFEEVLARMGDLVFDPATGRGRYVFYNVGPLRSVGKLDVISLGETQAEAEAALTEELPELLGLG